ncbi:replicative helicase loader/inhibitor [Neobacillus ginsengisoli]|uniref:Replicative helicase inhibitor G39P N-terminal domain-containing protein n=1 Tax=Neobacillus ginsengisoli TaxID=904295 RepID=A0ABT9XXB3_9BACI|nr:replicative helicase loader/inhibitor [Neobacillus ginsengisoli]MDQ0200139.1 hypothetical protein [Neobacillus ginsengisoli]
MTKKEVLKILVLIETVYSYCMTKDETVSYWFQYCSEMEFDKVMAKLLVHIRKSPYPPSISELTEFTSENTKQAWISEYTPKKSV